MSRNYFFDAHERLLRLVKAGRHTDNVWSLRKAGQRGREVWQGRERVILHLAEWVEFNSTKLSRRSVTLSASG